jgi:hypothetical protein
MALLRALLYLRLTSLANLVRSRLFRLRQPKYLLGAIAGAAYIWIFFIRGLGPRSNSQNLTLAFSDGRAEIFAAIILSIFILLIWVLPSDAPGLSFKESEVAFLFPAPLSRAQLIHYKLLDGLVTSLLGAIFFAIVSTGLRNGWLEALRHFGAWWVLNANLALHQSLAAFAIGRLSALGLTVTWRRTLLLAGAILTVVGLIAVAVRSGADTLGFLLWPARLVVRPFLTDHAGLYALALLPPLGLLALQYFAVHRLASPFEEASIVRAQKTAEVVANMRAGKAVHLGGSKQRARPDPFRLGPRLPVEFALLWKNLLVAPSYLNRKVFLGALVLSFAGLTWVRAQAHLDGPKIAVAVGVIALALLAYLLLFGPQLARFDLRGDLLHADMLKAWPLPGWRVVLGGLLAPTLLLSAIAWVLVFIAAVGLSPLPGQALWLTPQLRLAAVAAITLILPALCALQLLVPNGATLLFPAWAQTGRSNTAGMDVMGQRMIFFVGQFICLLLALLPAVVAGGTTIFLTQWLIGTPAAVLLAALPVLAILGVELWLGVHWVGLKFEALDISAELRP